MHLLTTLERFFRRLRPLGGRGGERQARSGDRVLVAFSGGPDSTALLWGLTRVAPALGLDLVAAHLDHRLDADSTRRAEAASRLVAALAVPLVGDRLAATPAGSAAGEGVEAYARRRRYAFLDRVAAERRARFIATAHHAEDQAETVILRLLYGSGLAGLAAIHPHRGRVVRPLLDLPRRALLEGVAASGLEPVDDPTNADLEVPRNRVRHVLLPRLAGRDPRIVERLSALARAAAAARQRVDEALEPLLAPRPLKNARGATIDRRALEALPEPLFAPALALLSRRAGAPHPPGEPARRELRRQLGRGDGPPRIGCDCGDGWRWEGDRNRLRLLHGKPSTGRFAYTLRVPGEVEISELALKVRLRRGRVARWMFRGRADRAGLASSLPTGTRVVVRNRRPGDRIQPLGAKEPIRLKDLLIARRIPRHRRDRLPLLVIDGALAWVPGVTIDQRFRLGDEPKTWIAEIESWPAETDEASTERS